MWREENKLAYGLTRRTVLIADTDIWVEELPSDLDNVFQNDLIQWNCLTFFYIYI